MSSNDLGHDSVRNSQINKVEFLAPNKEGGETFSLAGLEVSLDRQAASKFTLYATRNEIILVRAGVEIQQIEDTLNRSRDPNGHVDPSRFFTNLSNTPIPQDVPVQRTIDVIFVENRRGTGDTNETSRVTHITRGDPKLNRLQVEVNGPMSNYVIAEKSQKPGPEKSPAWQTESSSQGKTRTVIFVEGDSSLTAKLTGGNRLSLEGDKATFPVIGTNREYPSDFRKPLMYVITEADTKDQPLSTTEITSRINRITSGYAQGVIVIR